jgi:hypothetical protein
MGFFETGEGAYEAAAPACVRLPVLCEEGGCWRWRRRGCMPSTVEVAGLGPALVMPLRQPAPASSLQVPHSLLLGSNPCRVFS